MRRSYIAAVVVALPVLFLLYFFGLTGTGLVGPDEPRYAAIGREMASSGDWITPRLWGEPWFEKPPWLYWMTGAAVRLGLGPEMAPRLPVAVMGVAFLVFFFWILRREFGEAAAAYATLMLATSAGWVAFSHSAVPDLPMAALFSAAMLLSLEWLEKGACARLPVTAALLGGATLAKGLVPLVLALPLVWMGRRRVLDWLRPQVAGAFVVVALPWYLLCWLRNGQTFLEKFFWEQHVSRFLSNELAHPQPFWFFLPVIVFAVFPWIPALVPLARRSMYLDVRRRFLGLWVVFGLIFFSASANKLPGYIVPLIPAVAALAGLALAEWRGRRWVLAGTAALLVLLGPAAVVLPEALAGGVSRISAPAFRWVWLLPLFAACVVWFLESAGHRLAPAATLAVAIAAGVAAIEVRSLPAVDRAASARALWSAVAPVRDHVCVARLHRSLRYGLNYYSITPLPDCHSAPREIEITQDPGSEPRLVNAVAAPASFRP